ncbi:hypothetical protein AC1031_001503 [Aphanomyces cochlioides]|nr:hypothetical protein AC1031_001503 [Aphanomyces cochlioides]
MAQDRGGPGGPYEPINTPDGQRNNDGVHESALESQQEMTHSSTSRSSLRILPLSVRRFLNSSTASSTDQRSDANTATETYDTHETPTNQVVTDLADGLPPLALDMKESFHRKSVATSIAAGSVHYNTLPRRPAATPFAVPRVTLQETQRYTFAIILRNNHQVARLYQQRLKEATTDTQRANLSPEDMTAHVAALQQKALRRLVQAGLGVILLDNDTYITEEDVKHGQTNNICILVDPYKNKGLLNLEFMREKDELAIAQGNATARLGEARLPISGSKDICFSPALELQLTHNIIRNAFRDYDQDECDLDRNFVPQVMDVVEAMFPLHDKKFNNDFFREYRRHTFKLKWGKTVTGNSERWAIEELRLHFGERVAFLFAFMHIYTKALVPVMMILGVYYLSFRFGNNTWDQYLIGLAVMGFLITSVWAPMLLHLWNRETLLLVEKWNLSGYKQTVFESNDENPHYEYTWEQNVLTHQYEKMPKKRRVGYMRATMVFFVLLSCVVQCIVILPFIQWYVYAKGVDSCATCRDKLRANNAKENYFSCVTFITCFKSETSVIGTDRWVYILLQGIILGLVIDVVFFEFFRWLSMKFVHWENCAKKSQFESKLIHRSFVFVWTNWFFWFLFLAFVYLPLGTRINDYLQKLCNNLGLRITWKWDPSVLSLDQLFVTPLVATQFLNMLLETWVPYVMKKYRGKHVNVRYWFKTWSCSLRREKLSRTKRAAENKSARKLARDVSSSTRFFVPVLERSDDDNQHTAYEIVAESKLPEFDTQGDYLDAAIQFSYVVMFTVVWPLLPIPAFINNVLEVRGDAFRLLFCHRRPMPRRDVSIGEWGTALVYANMIGITVVSIFIVMYHGIAYFMEDCNFTFSKAAMVPLFTVNSSMAVDSERCKTRLLTSNELPIKMAQVVAFIVLEHLGFIFRYLASQGNKIPSSIGNPSYLRLKQLRELTAKRSALVEQFEYMKQLRIIFDKYDVDGIDHLYEEELALFLAEWVGTDRAKLNSTILFRYMDKTRLGKVPFSTCCLMLRHAEYDRFFSVLLGTCDSLDNFRNDGMRLSITDEGLGAQARHLSRFRSLSNSTPRHSADMHLFRDSMDLTSPLSSSSQLRQRSVVERGSIDKVEL